MIQVLLVDDDEDDYIVLRGMLSDCTDERYALEWAPSYEAGLAALARCAHDVYLIDYRLGERNGLELIRSSLREDFRAPLILLTGFGDGEIDRQALELGAADFLVKGQISPEILSRAIRYSLKHAKDLQELREREAQILHQDRLASIGALASGLVHEVGTPLNVIRGRAEYLAMQSEKESQRQGLEIIVNQIDRITKLLRSLLQLARNEHSPKLTDISPREIIDQLAILLHHEFRRHGIDFAVEVPEDAILRAEREPLQQVLLNLLVNSVHAIQSAIEAGRIEPHRITLRLHSADREWILEISDTGCGIPAAQLRNLFKPFFTTKAPGTGTGLGLATCARIVQSWHGMIDVQSHEGTGTTFRLRLPRAAVELPAQDEARAGRGLNS